MVILLVAILEAVLKDREYFRLGNSFAHLDWLVMLLQIWHASIDERPVDVRSVLYETTITTILPLV